MATMYDDLSRPPLSQAELTRALTGGGSRWSDVLVLPEAGSTNAVAAERARAGAPDGLVVLAEYQSAGRGRVDRSWVAPPRSGVTMSVLLYPHDVPTARWPWLPLLTGLAVAAAVQQAAKVTAELKWPNDVLVGDRKLAGILVEVVDGPRGAAAVIGVGLNVTLTEAELPVPEATSLLLEGAGMTDRSTLVKATLRRLEGVVAEWERSNGIPGDGLRSAYRSACTTLGRAVSVALPDGSTVVGDAVGIDDVGRLVVQTVSRRHAFGAGEVTHLRAAP